MYVQGRGAIKGDLHRRITVTLSNFLSLGPDFFAQNVENRRARLSRPFLGHGDNFSKSYAQDCSKKKVPTPRPLEPFVFNEKTYLVLLLAKTQ